MRVNAQEIRVIGPTSYSFWSCYLEMFSEVIILARVGQSNRTCLEEAKADGPLVSFCALPDYRGPWQYLRNLSNLKASVRLAVRESDAYILRVPGLVGRLAWQEIRRVKKPYALEVVAIRGTHLRRELGLAYSGLFFVALVRVS